MIGSMKLDASPYPPRMYMAELPGAPSQEPAWFRRLSVILPTTDQVFPAESNSRTSGTALGHCPQPARTMLLTSAPPVKPNACDSSHGSGRSATPASFHGPPPTEASTVVWAKRVPPM